MLSLGQGLFTERSQIRPSSHAKLRAFGMFTGACQKTVELRETPQKVWGLLKKSVMEIAMPTNPSIIIR